MKTFLILPLFALLPFVAFPNGTPEIKNAGNKNEIRVYDKSGKISNKKDCTKTLSYRLVTPNITIDIECSATASNCDKAKELAEECIDYETAIIRDILNT